MRNWNAITAISVVSFTLFSAYLWGIETVLSATQGKNPMCVFSLPMRNWNPFFRSLCSILLACFQPTYEELKQAGNIPKRVPAKLVFSLPMRNWNSHKWILLPSRTPFSAYLWGIETLLFYIACYLAMCVFSLPMRNWNMARWWLSAHRGLPFSAYLWGIETFVYNDRK